LLPLGLLPLLVACNGSSSSTTSSNAPAIANLRVSYVPTTPVKGQPVQITFLVDVVDPNGDWVGGTCNFTAGNVSVPIQAPGVATNATSGTGQCVVTETFGNVTFNVDLVVVDRAGNSSNTLSGSVQVERPSQS
jgi:hypothetical protein